MTTTLRYQFDDGGRAAAGRKGRKAGDCVARALAILTGTPYQAAYDALAAGNVKSAHKGNRHAGKRTASRGVYKAVYEAVYKAHGLVKVKLPAGEKPTWAEAHSEYGDCIVTTRSHVAAITGGCLRDIADCRTYDWDDGWGCIETRERKAMSVWVKADPA